MKTEPIRPARIDFGDAAAPFAVDFGDIYHPRAGALQQARHVFLAGNGLPERWRGRERFVILETGFGLGNNFLATWDAFRRDPAAPRRLSFLSIERHPLTREGLAAAPRDAALGPLAEQLVRAWPPLTCNLHRLEFDGGRVELLLALGDVAEWLPELVGVVDAYYLDGFAPARNPQMWQPRLFKAMARMAASGATAATWSAARPVRDGLVAAGFDVQRAPGIGDKRDITLARFAPRFMPRPAWAGRFEGARAHGHAVIVGAGLAGCALAHALAEQGWTSTLFERRDALGQEASGNPAGLYHGVVHAQDGSHARFNRAAALQAQQTIGLALMSGRVAGSTSGLLRLETSGRGAAAMNELLRPLGLPDDYVRALDAQDARDLSGLPLRHPAWLFPGGGWVQPARLAAELLQRAGSHSRLVTGRAVHALRRRGERWQVLDEHGSPLEDADAVLLANAGDALRLLGDPGWPLEAVRGQISLVDASRLPALPRLPVAGAGYLLPALNGQAVFGATAQAADIDPACREIDHAQNLAQLAAMTGWSLDVSITELSGRVGWRWVTDDRLPIAGAVPHPSAAAEGGRLEQPRLVPRIPGLFVFTGLGSRGIGWCALCARVIAAMVSGAPVPLESSLLDAIDPARFVSRRIRRAASLRMR